MTDRSTFDSFEQRIADELARYVAPVTDPKPATEIARVAMRPRRLADRARSVSRRRRYLVLGLAAALLVPAAYIGAAAMRPPAVDQVLPSRSDAPRPTAAPSAPVSATTVSIFVRRDESAQPGLAIFAVKADGTEAFLRKVPDSILAGHGKVSEYGTASTSGWLALGVDVQGGPWPMILVDLRDPQSQPWFVNEANLAAVGPRWGPTGLVAAPVGTARVVITDPETRATREIPMQGHGLVGGGPSIVWSGDGTGIIGSKRTYDTNGVGTYEVVPIDGGTPRQVGQVFDPNGSYGPGLAQLRMCTAGADCPGGDDGRIDRFAPDGSVQTIWRQQGVDRALGASFGAHADEYWLSVDHDGGRQVAIVHLHDGRQDAVATANRAADWQYLGGPIEAPDHSALMTWIDIGAKPAALLVPLTGAAPTFHTGDFVGFVDSAALALPETGRSPAPGQTLPVAGSAYGLPTLDELIAAELRMNPGRTVLGKATHEAVAGASEVGTVEVRRDVPGAGEAYLDCIGPSSVTVRSGSVSITSPCLNAGSWVVQIDASGPIGVTASGDTSWRVVLYSAP